jgi:hypothetical protein
MGEPEWSNEVRQEEWSLEMYLEQKAFCAALPFVPSAGSRYTCRRYSGTEVAL